MAYSLKLDELEVETFSTSGNVGISVMDSESEGGCGTHSLDYATHCDCSGGPLCTKACVAPSQATDQYCCG